MGEDIQKGWHCCQPLENVPPRAEIRHNLSLYVSQGNISVGYDTHAFQKDFRHFTARKLKNDVLDALALQENLRMRTHSRPPLPFRLVPAALLGLAGGAEVLPPVLLHEALAAGQAHGGVPVYVVLEVRQHFLPEALPEDDLVAALAPIEEFLHQHVRHEVRIGMDAEQLIPQRLAEEVLVGVCVLVVKAEVHPTGPAAVCINDVLCHIIIGDKGAGCQHPPVELTESGGVEGKLGWRHQISKPVHRRRDIGCHLRRLLVLGFYEEHGDFMAGILLDELIRKLRPLGLKQSFCILSNPRFPDISKGE